MLYIIMGDGSMNYIEYNRRSIRLRGYNYSKPGYYYVTIDTFDYVCHFGHVSEGKMVSSDMGKIAQKCWLEIPQHFPNIVLDEFIIMPEHVHGIRLNGNFRGLFGQKMVN